MIPSSQPLRQAQDRPFDKLKTGFSRREKGFSKSIITK
jgi:hypothetical protein